MKALLAAAALAMAGCSMNVIEPGDDAFVITPVGDWKPEELAEMRAACDDWKAFTDGALSCRLGDDGEARAIRGPTGVASPARIARMERAVYFDPDKQPSIRALGASFRNAFGKVSGVPSHGEPGVMNSTKVQHDFTEADRDACRVAGFCR